MKSALIEPLEARIAPATLVISSASVSEGDSGTKTLDFTVTLDAPAPEGGVTVQYATADGTATAGSDYVAKSGGLTFAAGETSKTIQVVINGDLTGEDDETFTIQLSDAVNATIGTAQGTGTILNDAKLSIATPTALVEGDSGEAEMVFTVSLTEGFTKPVTVQYHTVDGTATADSDYVAKTGTLTFEPTETSKTIHVAVNGDMVSEGNETFKVQLSDPVNATLTTTEATGTISNDDASLSISTPTALLEGDSGTKMMVFTVSLAHSSTKEVKVQYRTVNGTAVAGSDFEEKIGELIFAPGETSKTIEVPIIGDLTGESDESFKVELHDAVNATINTAEGTGTILNDAKLSVSAPEPVLEGNSGDQQMVFTVTLTEAGDQTVTVNYTVSDGASPNGATGTGTDADYSISSTTGTLTFEPGVTSQTVAVTVKGDTRQELNETVQFQLNNAQHAAITQGSAIGTILDDEVYDIGKITINDVVITEGDSGTSTAIFTLTLSSPVPSGQQLVVHYKTVDGTAIGVGDVKDFDGISDGTVIFTGSEVTKTIAVTIRGDRSFEGAVFGTGSSAYRAEQFQVQITGGTLEQSGTGEDLRSVTFASGSDTTALVTIKDTDSLPTLSIADYVVLEGNTPGEKTAQFTVTLSEPAGFDVRVDFATVNGTAILNQDFTLPQNLFITIPAGSKTGVISIPIIGDTVFEADKTFGIQLQSGTAKILTSPDPQVLNITRAQAMGTILNDEVNVEMEVTNEGKVIEGNGGALPPNTYIIKLKLTTGAHTAPITVNLMTQDGTAISTGEYADFDAISIPVTFAPGQTEVEVPITIKGDLRKEGNETFKVVLSQSNTAGNNVAIGGGTTGVQEQTVTILQEENEPTPTVSLSYEAPTGGVLVEGGKAKFIVTLSEPTNQDVEVTYDFVTGATGGTARGGESAFNDYIKGSNLKVVIPAGQKSATFTVDTIDDALFEGNVDETIKVKLVSVTGDTAIIPDPENQVPAVAEIRDNDQNVSKPTLTISDYTLIEGNEGEKFATFTIRLSAATGVPVTVRASTLNLTGTGLATAGEDFVEKINELITIPANTLTATFSVKINSDTLAEGDERFFVELKDPSNAILAGVQGSESTITATGTILNDDAQYQILFQDSEGNYTLPTLTLNEEGTGNAQQNVSFIIKRIGDISAAGEVSYRTVDGVDYMDGETRVRGAVSSGPRIDFATKSGVVTFAAGESSSAPITIQLNPDTHYEGLEEFKIQLLDSVDNFAKVRITDNEVAPTITISNPTAVLEGNASGTSRQQSSVVFEVKLSHVDETGTVSMLYNTANDDTTGAHTATSSIGVSVASKSDYTGIQSSRSGDGTNGVQAPLTFAPGETTKSISVTVLGDNRDEYDETFKLVLSDLKVGDTARNFGVGTDNQPITTLAGIGTIADNDAAAVVSITDLVTQAKDSSGNPIANQYDLTTYAETDISAASTNKYFLVTLIGETEKLVTVKYSTRSTDGTVDPNVHAIAGEDFVGVTNGVITFDPNNATESQRTTQQLKIEMINDTIVEGDQSFEVVLSDPTDAQLGDKRGVAVILDDQNDDPLVAINDIRLVEGDFLQGAKFTVTLATPAQRAVTINYATVDGTGKATGLFADYIATSGSITIPAGQTSHEIDVQIIGDNFKEADETFKVQLSGLQSNNADVRFVSTGAGTATIENGDDSIIGIGINDLKIVEGDADANGNPTQKNAAFQIELSAPLSTTQATTLNAAVRSGTAIKGVASAGADFENKSGVVSIAAGQTTGTFNVAIFGDNTFESTEHFFADLSNLPSGVQAVKTTARAEIYNDDVRLVDSRTLQWIDLDGDLVTLRVSKGTLDGSNIGWVTDSNGNVVISSTGGRALQILDVNSGEFQNANITIISDRQAGFTGDANGVLGDGRVNVGFISAAVSAGDGNIFGVDLGTVTVDGDLGGINVGDRFVDGISLRKLDVYSLGLHPDSSGLIVRDSSGNITGLNTSSLIQGAVGVINVRTDFAGKLTVSASRFGNINSLNIGGSLRGLDNFDQTGTIVFTGTLKNAVIGEITGGVGGLSGRIEGNTQYVGNIGTITVKGDVAGNSGSGSGVIAAASIGKVQIGRLLGGSGEDAGQIRGGALGNVIVREDVIGFTGAQSGSILTDGNFGAKTGERIGSVRIGGRLIGGAGELSGVLSSGAGGFTGITIGGNVFGGENALFSDLKAAVQGGDGAQSGTIISSGSIKSLVLGHALRRGEQPDQLVSIEGGRGAGSGGVNVAGTIKTATLFGDLKGGTGAESGVIAAGNLIAARILGDIEGGKGNKTGVIDVGGAIGSLVVGGDLKGGSSEAASTDAGATTVETTGAILAGRINKILITGDIVAGQNLGAGLSGSGSIAVNGPMKQMVVLGSLKGQKDVPIRILAFGSDKEAAIGSLVVGSGPGADVVEFTEVTAGVSIRSNRFGFPVNADAKIGTVVINGDVQGLNITAGANKGPDGIFATADDQVLNNTLNEIDNARVYSSIAKVIINGQITEVAETSTGSKLPYGIVAQQIGEILYTGSNGRFARVPLERGAGNDTADAPQDGVLDPTPGVAINTKESFRAIELPIV